MSNPLDIQNLSAFIFDLDGVVWRGDAPVNGVPEAIAQLKAAGKKCLYCTNNASKTQSDYVEKLAAMGVEAEEDEIMTSAVATAIYLSSQLTGQFSAYVVGEEGLVSALQKVGARVVTASGLSEMGDLVVENAAFPVDCVVAGIDRSFSYEKLRLAQSFILNGARFIATNRDSTFPIADGGVVPGAGAIVSAIETSCGTSPLTVGKPQALMPILLMQKFDLDKNTTVFVGDRLETDIVAAHRAEIKAIFVESGVSTREQAERARGQQKPDAIYRDVVEMCAKVLEDVTETRVDDESQSAPSVNASIAPATTAKATAEAEATADVFSFDEPASNGAAAAKASALVPTPPAIPAPTITTSPEQYSFANVDEDVPSEVEVEPAPAEFAFSLDDASPLGTLDSNPAPRLAPHLAAPSLSPSVAKPAASGAQAKGQAMSQSEPAAPAASGADKEASTNVEEPLDNWWESIEDAFKKK